jgi:hypothetical protein
MSMTGHILFGQVEELLPIAAPEPLGNHVTLTHYVDANIMHDIAMGRSVTGILHLMNKTPIEWYSKKQATVETATYGSEFVAARVCTEQIIGECEQKDLTVICNLKAKKSSVREYSRNVT